MTAGTGIRHSEFNQSDSNNLRFLQIWIEPELKGLPPDYEKRPLRHDVSGKGFELVASRDGRDGSLTVHQDVDIYHSLLHSGRENDFSIRNGRCAWAQVFTGSITINGMPFGEGDGAAIQSEASLSIGAGSAEGEFFLFDLA